MQVQRACTICGTRLSLACTAFAFVTALAGCGDDHASRADDVLSHGAAERVPMLPGAGHAPAAAQPSQPVVAQRFGLNGNAVAPAASAPLLPPVMHSAD
jgi:hypothetical protein